MPYVFSTFCRLPTKIQPNLPILKKPSATTFQKIFPPIYYHIFSTIGFKVLEMEKAAEIDLEVSIPRCWLRMQLRKRHWNLPPENTRRQSSLQTPKDNDRHVKAPDFNTTILPMQDFARNEILRIVKQTSNVVKTRESISSLKTSEGLLQCPQVIAAVCESRSKSDQTLRSEVDTGVHNRINPRETKQVIKPNRTGRQQDVNVEDLRPLIDIAYWSAFVEVRRDAAAAFASLARNPANLEVLSEVGTLGALLSMLNVDEQPVDASIARDCAQALSSMVKLSSVKQKLYQAPNGLDCVFALLCSTDEKLCRTAFEIVRTLVSVEDFRIAVVKTDGFSIMLNACLSKDAQIRCCAASILHHLVESRDNRFAFCESNHFELLSSILRDRFIERDALFRQELLNFMLLLVMEEENAKRIVELNFVPALLLLLDVPKANMTVYATVVAILERLAMDKKNHCAIVSANVLPRIIQLCLRNVMDVNLNRPVYRQCQRPQTTLIHEIKATNERSLRPSRIVQSRRSEDNSRRFCSLCPEYNAILRPVFAIFCEMAKNPMNRDHIIRTKVVDLISGQNLYAAQDKRVRRSSIALLILLICKERDRDRRIVSLDSTDLERQYQFPLLTKNQEAEYKHYIELLARGVVHCLFGILGGSDFSMKVDAIGAIAQLTQDENSRITMCKSQLLKSLKEFAFHPLLQTRCNVAKIIANFSERAENVLKLVDEGMLSVLLKYVSPMTRNTEVVLEATRAIVAMSMVHAARAKIVESGVLSTLMQYCKASNTPQEVRTYASAAIRNLRHDAAALRIQAIYRGWYVRIHNTPAPLTHRRRRMRKLNLSSSKEPTPASITSLIDGLVQSSC